MRSRSILVPTLMAFGFAFLYVPILSMIAFSFNYSKLVTVWDAARSPTLRWYKELFDNEQIMRAAWLSIKIATVNATGEGNVGGVRERCRRRALRYLPILDWRLLHFAWQGPPRLWLGAWGLFSR